MQTEECLQDLSIFLFDIVSRIMWFCKFFAHQVVVCTRNLNVAVACWPGGQSPPPPSDNFLGALKFVIANVKHYKKIYKVQLVNKLKDSNNSGISIAIQLSDSFWE